MVTVGVTAASLVGGELLPQLRGRLDVSRMGDHGMFRPRPPVRGDDLSLTGDHHLVRRCGDVDEPANHS